MESTNSDTLHFIAEVAVLVTVAVVPDASRPISASQMAVQRTAVEHEATEDTNFQLSRLFSYAPNIKLLTPFFLDTITQGFRGGSKINEKVGLVVSVGIMASNLLPFSEGNGYLTPYNRSEFLSPSSHHTVTMLE